MAFWRTSEKGAMDMPVGGSGPTLTPYEEDVTGPTQWWTDDGVYIGYDTAKPEDMNHPLRSRWDLTGERRHYRQDRHILTVGPNGSGKTRRLLLPNLYSLKHWSIVAIDPKGELFAHTAEHRAATPGHKIMLFDPFGVVAAAYPKLAARFPCQSLGFNPLGSLDASEGNLRFVDDVKALSVALIQTEDAREKYWPLAAQALVKGLLMALRLKHGAAATLGDLRNRLGLTPRDLATYADLRIKEFGQTSPAIAATLGEFATYSAEDREQGGIRRTAKVQTDWLDSPQIRTELQGGTHDFATLKNTPTTIYLVIPPEYLATHGVWLRLMVMSILQPLLRSVARPRVPVLFMLDEFAQLGRMEIIEDNYALMRGFGVKLWPVFQDLNQAQNLYRDRWESFVSNAGIFQAFAPQDLTTRKYLSDLADRRMSWHARPSASGSFSFAKAGASLQSQSSTSEAEVTEPLMYPYELGQLGQGQSVIFTQRGHVRRMYFPDASQIPGVGDMMASLAKEGL